MGLQGETLEKLLAHEARYLTMAAALEKTPCAWFLYGPLLPAYRDANHAFRLRDDGRGPDAVAQEVVTYYRARGLPPIADVDAVAEAQSLGAALRRLGVAPVRGDWLLMRYARDEPPAVPPNAVEVRAVPNETGAGETRDWIEIAQGNPEDEHAALWRAVVAQEARFRECRLYLGLLDGQPAGTCDLFAAEGWGRIESVMTRPEFRRRGVASALVARAVADSLQNGHTETYLFTEPDSDAERLYTRLGFARWQINVMRRHIGR